LAIRSNTSFAAGSSTVNATLDTNQIRIGEQFRLNLSAVPGPGSFIAFPVIPDTLNGLEVVERGKVDTLQSTPGGPLTLRQQLVLTCFDSGYYVIEPFVFTSGNPDGSTDSLLTEAQLIAVKTIPVDTTKAFKDIKPVMSPPFDWRELLPWLWVLLIVLFLILTGRWLYKRYRRKGRQEPVVTKPTRPAHEIAFEALEKLEKEKLWQQGYYKEYHIRLTDILRGYIEQRFGVASQESTTDETLIGIRSHLTDAQELAKLEQILRLADLVKFAKAIPILTENEQALTDARSFITATAIHTGKERQP
jgi:hypothetical protein